MPGREFILREATAEGAEIAMSEVARLCRNKKRNLRSNAPTLSRVLLLTLMLAAPLGLGAAEALPADCKNKDTLFCLVFSGTLGGLRWPDFSDYRTQIRNFYENAHYAFAWLNRGVATEQAKAVINVLKDAETVGLNSEDYDGSRWADRLAVLSQAGKSPSEYDLARFDLALTISVMRYTSDLHFGKLNSGLFHTGSDVGFEEGDLAGFVRNRLVNAGNVNAIFNGIEPPHEGYRRTKQALQRYLALAREDIPSTLPLSRKPLERGDSYAFAAQLADMLRRFGDLPAEATVLPDLNTYGSPLVDAVKHFQTRHGLEPDGRLGKNTLAQLNIPVSYRVRQLQLTLERWRWAPHYFSRPPIVVNIPEFELRAVSPSYETELAMKVVVGKALGHQTPMFAANLKYVVFRPYWNVPFSIQRAELVPKLDRDRSYLLKNKFEVVTAQNKLVSTGVVDDNLLARLRSGELRIRQVPGPENSLGLVAFLFPNEYNVYLHATPARELFSKSRRDFSHGCIRAEKPEELAAWVLRDKPEWTPERISAAMNGTETIRITLDRPISVLIVYATAVVLENGEVLFFKDIYGQDAQIERLLAKGYPYKPWRPTSGEHGRRPSE